MNNLIKVLITCGAIVGTTLFVGKIKNRLLYTSDGSRIIKSDKYKASIMDSSNILLEGSNGNKYLLPIGITFPLNLVDIKIGNENKEFEIGPEEEIDLEYKGKLKFFARVLTGCEEFSGKLKLTGR